MMRNRAVAASCPNFVYIFCLSGVHASLLSIGTPRGGRRAPPRRLAAQIICVVANTVHGSARGIAHTLGSTLPLIPQARAAGGGTYSSLTCLKQSSDAPSLHAVETRRRGRDAHSCVVGTHLTFGGSRRMGALDQAAMRAREDDHVSTDLWVAPRLRYRRSALRMRHHCGAAALRLSSKHSHSQIFSSSAQSRSTICSSSAPTPRREFASLPSFIRSASILYHDASINPRRVPAALVRHRMSSSLHTC